MLYRKLGRETRIRRSILAGLTKDVVIVGMDSRLEIWSKDKWNECDDDISADEIAEKMEMLGI